MIILLIIIFWWWIIFCYNFHAQHELLL